RRHTRFSRDWSSDVCSSDLEYTGREVWVRGESRLIRIYTLKMEPITVHARIEPGRSRTEDAHIHPLKRRLADRGSVYLLERCQRSEARSVGKGCRSRG